MGKQMSDNQTDFVFLACLALACAIVCAAVLMGSRAGIGNPFGIFALGVLLAAFVALAGLAVKIVHGQTHRTH
jgi:hypothetical protein